MDLVKAFIDNELTAEINIQGTSDDPLFQANQIGKLLDIKDINSTIRDFDDDEKEAHSMHTLGGEQKVIFLTEIGLYKLLGMSRKPIAKKFNKWVTTVIREIRKTGQYKLEGELKNVIENSKLEIEKNRHNLLIEKYNNIPGAYFGKIQEIDDKLIIKIGSTHDIDRRTIDLKKYFSSFILLDFFEANRYRALETSLLKDANIKQYEYIEPINGHVSTETFLIPKEFYTTMLGIAKRKQKDYQGITEEHAFELEKQKNEILLLEKQKELELIALQKLQIQNSIPPTPIIKEVPLPYIINKDLKINKGKKIQKYTLDGKLVNTYNGLNIAARIEPRISESGLKNAIKNKTIYKNHRWLGLDRDKPDDTIQEIGESKNIIVQNLEFIAMLDINKENIIHVFPDQLSAAQSRHFISTVPIHNAIKKNRICSGHWFMHYNKCSDELKNKYLETNTLPEINRRHNAISVKQLHPVTNEIIKEFKSCAEVQRNFQMDLSKLKQVIKDDIVYKGYKWSK